MDDLAETKKLVELLKSNMTKDYRKLCSNCKKREAILVCDCKEMKMCDDPGCVDELLYIDIFLCVFCERFHVCRTCHLVKMFKFKVRSSTCIFSPNCLFKAIKERRKANALKRLTKSNK